MEAAASGEQAWVAARGRTRDLVLSDVVLPGLDGIELTRRLRAAARTATVPIILITDSHETTFLEKGFEAGADDFLRKPFSPAERLARLGAHRKLVETRRGASGRPRPRAGGDFSGAAFLDGGESGSIVRSGRR